jgi:hypothetical protein
MFDFRFDLAHYYTARENIELSTFHQLINADASRFVPQLNALVQKIVLAITPKTP